MNNEKKEKKSLKKLDTVHETISRTAFLRLVIVIARYAGAPQHCSAYSPIRNALRLMCNLLKSSSVINSQTKGISQHHQIQYNHINVIIFIHLFGVNICLLFYSSSLRRRFWFGYPLFVLRVVLHENFSFVFMVDGVEARGSLVNDSERALCRENGR